MERKISILEDVSKEIINLFFKKNENSENSTSNFFSFYFDEEPKKKEIKKYKNFDDIPIDIYDILNKKLLHSFDFNKEIIKKYIIIVKKIKQKDIDILNLILKSISLNKDILHYKLLENNNKFKNHQEFENFILKNIHYNLNDYNNLLSKFYNIRIIKDLLLNIYVLIYNYSIYNSINIFKKVFI